MLSSIIAGDTTPTPKSGNLPLDVEYVRRIVVPIIVTLLFLILLALGIGITCFCVRTITSSLHKKAERERQERGSVTLDTLDRRSVNNIYPPLGNVYLPQSMTCGLAPYGAGPFPDFQAGIDL